MLMQVLFLIIDTYIAKLLLLQYFYGNDRGWKKLHEEEKINNCSVFAWGRVRVRFYNYNIPRILLRPLPLMVRMAN